MDAQSSEVNVLGDVLEKSLRIQDAQDMKSPSNGCEKEEDLCEPVGKYQKHSSSKCLNKCATFPYPNMALPAISSSDEEDEEPETVSKGLASKESKDPAYLRSISLPVSSHY